MRSDVLMKSKPLHGFLIQNSDCLIEVNATAVKKILQVHQLWVEQFSLLATASDLCFLVTRILLARSLASATMEVERTLRF